VSKIDSLSGVFELRNIIASYRLTSVVVGVVVIVWLDLVVNIIELLSCYTNFFVDDILLETDIPHTITHTTSHQIASIG